MLDRTGPLRRTLVASRTTRRAAIVVAVAAAAAVAGVVRLSPVSRLANYSADGPGPIYDHPPVDDAALRRAGKLLPGGARYLVVGQPEGDVLAGALLYFDPALPVGNPSLADWVLSYRATPRLPAGLRSLRTYRLGEGIFLFQVRAG